MLYHFGHTSRFYDHEKSMLHVGILFFGKYRCAGSHSDDEYSRSGRTRVV